MVYRTESPSRSVRPLGRRSQGLVLALSVALALPATVLGQLGSPEGWQVRTDQGGHGGGDLQFTDMPPGMHITTGPAGIFYHPEKTASVDFRVEAEVFLFDPGRANEAYGVFFGGHDLGEDGQVYTYFLIRRDGSVLVKRRDGARTSTMQDWTRHDAVVTWEGRGDDAPTAKNILSIEATLCQPGIREHKPRHACPTCHRIRGWHCRSSSGPSKISSMTMRHSIEAQPGF